MNTHANRRVRSGSLLLAAALLVGAAGAVQAQDLQTPGPKTFPQLPQPVAKLAPVGNVMQNYSLPLHTGGELDTQKPISSDPEVLRGEYLAKVGDCIACHTATGGKPFAGGLPIASPIGTIYSSNITPDKDTGIGNDSYEDFDRAVRSGVAKDGHSLYPAMPYTDYARIKPADVKALYAYFMQGVQPVNQANKPTDIPWPLSMRWPLGIWRAMFAPTPVSDTAAPGGDAVLARGEYLVESLGHCSACHTARGVALQEKALTASDGPQFLAGGQVLDGWTAPSLRNENGDGLAGWSEQDIAEFLKTGRTAHTAAFGGMSEVVTDSTQYMSDDDLHAVAVFLKSLGASNNAQAYQYDTTVAQQLFNGQPGSPTAQLFLDRCAACHRANGTGFGKAFPALAGNPVLQTQDPTSAIHIILSGSREPYTSTAPSMPTMAPYANILSDQQIADLVTFVQQSWGNKGGAATADQVAKLRKTSEPVTPAPHFGTPEAAPQQQ